MATTLEAAQQRLLAIASRCHDLALRKLGQPYATLTSQLDHMWTILSVLMEKYPTLKVFVYCLSITCALPLASFVCLSTAIFLAAISVACVGVGMTYGSFLVVGGFLLASSLVMALFISCGVGLGYYIFTGVKQG